MDAAKPAARGPLVAEMKKHEAEAAAAEAAYRQQAADPKIMDSYGTAWTDYQRFRDAQLAASQAGNTAEALAQRTQAAASGEAAQQALATAVAAESADAKTKRDQTTGTYQGARTLIVALLVVGLLLGLVLGLYVSRLVVRPLQRVSAVLSALADGDLTSRAQVSSRDEVGQMA